MTLTQFKYVMEIVKTGSVNQAASNLFVAQSVLSNSLKTLEDELEEKIFYRTAKGMQLTPFGQNFVSYISPIQMQMDQLNLMLRRNAKKTSTSLRIATTGFYQMSGFLADIVKEKGFSDARIEIIETSLEESMHLISNDLADIAFIRRWSCYYDITNKRLESSKIDYVPIRSFPIGVAIGEGNHLFGTNCKVLSREMLRQFPCIMYNYIESGPYHNIYDQLGITYDTRIVTNSRAVTYELVANTPGYFLNAPIPDIPSVKSGSGIEPEKRRTLLIENCDIEVEYGWMVKRGHSKSVLEEKCISMATDWLYSE